MSRAISNFLFIFVITTIVAAICPTLVHGISKEMAHIRVYMHDKVNAPNSTASLVVTGTQPITSLPGVNFGEIVVLDDPLTEGPTLHSAPMGRGKGFYPVTSFVKPNLLIVMTVALTAGEYNGSSIAIMGDDDISAPVRELSVIGGTGQFRMARGYVIWKTIFYNATSSYVILELDIYATKGNTY